MLGSSQSGGRDDARSPRSSRSASRRSRLSARSGRPPRLANALGRSPPNRSPRPAATSTAQTPEPLALTCSRTSSPSRSTKSSGLTGSSEVWKSRCDLRAQELLGVAPLHDVEGERDEDVVHGHGVHGRAAVATRTIWRRSPGTSHPGGVVAVGGRPTAELPGCRTARRGAVRLVVRLREEVVERELSSSSSVVPQRSTSSGRTTVNESVGVDDVDEAQVARERGRRRLEAVGAQIERRLEERHQVRARRPRARGRRCPSSRRRSRVGDHAGDDLVLAAGVGLVARRRPRRAPGRPGSGPRSALTVRS